MKQSISFGNSGQQATQLLKSLSKYHYLMFISLMLAGAVYAVFNINQVISIPSDETFRQSQQKNAINGDFDQAAIEQVQKLRFSNNPEPDQLPAGRTKLFTE